MDFKRDDPTNPKLTGINGIRYNIPEGSGLVQSFPRAELEAASRLFEAAPHLLRVLERIVDADDSGNNGSVTGEAVLCRQFSLMAKEAIAIARGTGTKP